MSDDKRESPVQFRPGRALAADLAARATHGPEATSANEIARRDLLRHYAAMRRDCPRVAPEDARALLAALGGTAWEPESIPHLWMTADDAFRDAGLAEQFGVDGGELVARLRALTYGQSLALADAIERLAALPDPTDNDLRRAGLVE